MLAAVFLAGTSAGSLGYGFCWHLNDWRISALESRFPHAASYQFGSEQEHRAFAVDRNLVMPAVFQIDRAGIQPNPYWRKAAARSCQLWADYRKYSALDFKQVTNSNLNLSLFIAQRHGSKSIRGLAMETFGLNSNPWNSSPLSMIFTRPADHVILFAASPFKTMTLRPSSSVKVISTIIQTTPSRLITALRYRQLYTFQNQFISLMRISCLRDAGNGTSVSRFSSISCPRPLVLRQLEFGALGFGLGCTFRLRHCAAVVWAAGCDMQLLPSEFERWFERFPESVLIHRTEDFNRGARIIALENRNQISDGHTAHSQFRIARTGERRFTQNPV